MTTDTKHQVLYALYAEYQKDVPEMEYIDRHSLEMDDKVFMAAMLKLQNEEYIQGFMWTPAETMNANKVRGMKCVNVFLTRRGVEYVEKQAEIQEHASASEKLKQLAKATGTLGLEILKEFILSKL